MVTGAGSGIGKATASQLLKDGFRVFGGVINQQQLNAIADTMGENFFPVIIDVCNEKLVQDTVAEVSGLLGDEPLLALLNIAGVISNGPLVDLDEKTFQAVISVNLIGVHNVSKAFLPLLRRSSAAKIINISSASGSRTMPFTGAYSASKFGLEALSSAMRMEYAVLGIDVVVIAPGLINTPMTEKIKHELGRGSSEPMYQEPLKKFLQKTIESSRNGIPISKIVDTIVHAVYTSKPALRYDIHHNYFRDVILMRLLPAKKREFIVRKILGMASVKNI